MLKDESKNPSVQQFLKFMFNYFFVQLSVCILVPLNYQKNKV